MGLDLETQQAVQLAAIVVGSFLFLQIVINALHLSDVNSSDSLSLIVIAFALQAFDLFAPKFAFDLIYIQVTSL
jgi:hypothetical protein